MLFSYISKIWLCSVHQSFILSTLGYRSLLFAYILTLTLPISTTVGPLLLLCRLSLFLLLFPFFGYSRIFCGHFFSFKFIAMELGKCQFTESFRCYLCSFYFSVFPFFFPKLLVWMAWPDFTQRSTFSMIYDFMLIYLSIRGSLLSLLDLSFRILSCNI